MIKKILGLTAVFGLVLLMGPVPAAFAQDNEEDVKQERECKNVEVSRTGNKARTVFFAKKSARDAWRQKVKAKYGNDWSAWLFSSDSDYHCFKQGGRNRCTAKAKPCKLAVVVQGPRKVCAFYQINGTGKPSKLKAWAQHNARKIWAERVRDFYGDNYDTWLLASNKETKCEDHADGTHTCTAMAKPCHFQLIN